MSTPDSSKDRYIYSGSNTGEISFPLGGLGTGSIGLSGSGRFIDWEIFNRPSKGSVNGFSHFAVKAERDGEVIDARILNGDLAGSLNGRHGRPKFYEGIGFGPARETLFGMPHFRHHEFRGEFPFSEIAFSDEKFPADVKLIAFNPFIPTNDKDSGIPAAFFEFILTNTTQESLDYTIVGALGNPFTSQGYNEVHHIGDYHLLRTGTDHPDKSAFEYGDLTIATDTDVCSYQEYWYRGSWSDPLEVYWRDFTQLGKFENRQYGRDEQYSPPMAWHDRDNGNLAAHIELAPGESRRIRFVITWNFPNNRNYWQPDADERAESVGLKNAWKNYYATIWDDSTASASYALQDWDRLYAETILFKDALFSSDLPDIVIEGISANLSVLKTPTVMRLEDGTFYGWEGVGESAGCCEGSCTHVWNYAQALAFLFPKLERSMRTANYKYNVDKDGGSHFRLQLPLGVGYNDFRPCADGQFGDVLKTYRDWKISGDTDWLRSIWIAIKATIEYAWSDKNPDQWDPEKTGVLWGRQHHTLDMELFGPNAWLTGYYLGALKAASEMATVVDESEFAQELVAIFERGKAWADENLFNGEYYGQVVDLNNRDILTPFDQGDDRASDMYWSEEHQEVKYQVGEGVEIDMVIAQWHANLYGLGEIFDRKQVKQALEATFRYSYKASMRDEYNPFRLYSVGDEAGLVICSWPEDRYKPAIPLPYSQETQNGYEWAAASHMVQAGLVDEGLTCIEAIRARYDGEHRNPWNEIECGSNYARSLASYSLLNIFAGFQFDMVNGSIGFDPIRYVDGHFTCFWSLDTGWGTVELTDNSLKLNVLYGSLELGQFIVPSHMDTGAIVSVSINGRDIEFSIVDSVIEFKESVTIEAKEHLIVKFKDT
jgi:non-lysosomal glucosylceramidase